MEDWKKRHPHALINIMSQELLRSLEENDLTQSKTIGNEIQALNTVAEENQKKLKKELEFAKAKIAKLENGNKNLNQEIEASENVEKIMELHPEFDEAVKKLQEKDTKIQALETQIEELKHDLDQNVHDLEASERKLAFAKRNIENMTQELKLKNTRVSTLENENNNLTEKYHKLENEKKRNDTKMELLVKDAKGFQEALNEEKQTNNDLKYMYTSLDIKHTTLKLKYQSLVKEEKTVAGTNRKPSTTQMPKKNSKPDSKIVPKTDSKVDSTIDSEFYKKSYIERQRSAANEEDLKSQFLEMAMKP